MPPPLLVVPKLLNFVTLIPVFIFVQYPLPVFGKVLSGLANLPPSDIFGSPLEPASLVGVFFVSLLFHL